MIKCWGTIFEIELCPVLTSYRVFRKGDDRSWGTIDWFAAFGSRLIGNDRVGEPFFMPTRKILIEIPDFLVNGSVFKTGIESFNWSDNRTIGATEGASQETTATPRRTLIVNRVRDRYSPVFHQTSNITKRFNKLKITVTQSDKGAVRQTNSYEFHNVVFADYETAAASNGMPPVEAFTLDFVTVDFNNGLPIDQPGVRRNDKFDLRALRRQ